MKKKKTIIILLIVFIVVVGVTIAYFSSSTSVENIFNTKEFETSAYEEFVSPDNWLPCTETPKTITVTNEGNVDAAVRISMQEKWINAKGVEISGLIDSNGNLTNNTSSEHAALINLADDCNWEEDNGYYYFKHILKPGETTTTLTDSVTFNCNTNASQTCTASQDGKTIVCTSSGDGYDNATYTLTFKIDTIQYDAYEKVWTDEVHISDISYNPITDSCSGGNTNPNNNSCSDESDEPITYKGEEYYVLDSTNSEYTTLLKKDVLTASEVNAISNEFESEDGEYPYGWGDDCNIDAFDLQCYSHMNYSDSNIKTVIDGWATKFGNDLVEVNGYKSRLLNEDELVSRLGFEYYNVITSYGYEATECTPNWAKINKFYWTDVSYSGTKKGVVKEEINYSYIFDNYYIRPVINVKKCALNNTCQ